VEKVPMPVRMLFIGMALCVVITVSIVFVHSETKESHVSPLDDGQYFTVHLKVPLFRVDSLFVRGTLSYVEAGLKNPEFKREMMELLSRFAEMKLNQFHKEVRDAEGDSAVGLSGAVEPNSL
jgi:hypothetical protein